MVVLTRASWHGAHAGGAHGVASSRAAAADEEG